MLVVEERMQCIFWYVRMSREWINTDRKDDEWESLDGRDDRVFDWYPERPGFESPRPPGWDDEIFHLLFPRENNGCFVYSWKKEISIEKIIRREKEKKSFSLRAWNKKKMYTTFWKEKLKKRNCAWIGKWKNFTKSRNCWRNEKNWKKQEKKRGI